MATVHPGMASSASASSRGLPPDHAQTVTCPFCKTTGHCPLVSDSALQQFPCPSCAENLIVLNPEARSADEETVTVAPRTDGTTGNTDLSRRMAGIAVAVLACLLNYALLSGVAYWMFTQIKATHDPYDIDELMLSPLILRSNGWTTASSGGGARRCGSRPRCCSQKQTISIAAMAADERPCMKRRSAVTQRSWPCCCNMEPIRTPRQNKGTRRSWPPRSEAMPTQWPATVP